MSRKNKNKNMPLTQSMMCKISKRFLGYGAKTGVSLYTLMVRVLAKHGKHKPEQITERSFAKQNAEFLIDLMAKPGDSIKVKKEPKYIEQVIGLVTKTPYSHPGLGKKEYSDFYKSTAWRQLRYVALKNTGGACQCCGAKAADGVTIHVDHILPRSRYPHLELSLDNLQVLCDDCNIGKGDWDETSWKQHFKSI